MIKEFKNFILTGNVIEFAVAVILAGAIGLVITGFVNDIIMPIVGHLVGGVDFADLKVVLSEEVKDAAGEVTSAENAIRWGAWINAIVNLILVGLVLFFMVKAYNKTKAPVEEAAAGPSQEELLTQIRDLLKK